MKRALIAVGVMLVILAAVTGIYYAQDSSQRREALQTGGTVVDTSVGPVEYQLVGNNPGQTLLFFHGTPGGYDQGIGALDNAQVLTLSRPGYLGTPLEVGTTPGDQAQAAAAVLDKLGIAEVSVMGASGGGPAAYTFAARYPERTLALVAMEAISHSTTNNEVGLPDSDFLFWLMIQSLVLTQDDAGVVAQIAQNESDREQLAKQPQKQKQVAGMIWSMWPPSMRKAGLDNDFTQFQNLNLPLESVHAPTLIVHGTLDQTVPFEHAEYALARVPNAQLYAIEGAGHMMPFAHEEEVNSAVTTFFAGIQSQPPGRSP